MIGLTGPIELARRRDGSSLMALETTTSAREIARRFNYWDPALDDDPHAVLSQLRDQCPVVRSEELGGYWFISSFDGVRQVLADTTTFSSRALTLPPEAAPEMLIPETIDPPEHAKYRRLFTQIGRASCRERV